MGHWGDILDGRDFQADGLEGADGGFTAGTGAVHTDLELAHAVGHGLAGGILGGLLRGKRRALAGALEADASGRAPADHVALHVRDGHLRVRATLKRFRRLHVYTPPGYEAGKGRFPVFYLLHGAFDSDDSWGTVGRAGFILDNLIAAGKAKPMVVVMPHGHTGPFGFGAPLGGEFEAEFVTDIMPQMEQRYRVLTDRAHRAIAGLSMGGAQTLNIGIPHLEKFGYLGVYSSGIFGIVQRPGAPGAQGPSFEEQHRAILDNAKLKKGLRLFWFATGKDDFLVETSRKTVEMFKQHQFNVVYRETEGAHTWINWREYLNEFAPQLFQ